ncbi:MAG: glycogen debranching protein GlgX [Actinomycetales bacterium]|nr:glycogen debranching protein GlgX [Actinomycetales bacterium]
MPAPDPLQNLGVTLTPRGGHLRVASATATGIELRVYDAADPATPVHTTALKKAAGGVWGVVCRELAPGALYSLHADGEASPRTPFDPERPLLDPYARGIVPAPDGSWRGVVVEGGFDWGQAHRPGIPLDKTVIYEAHVKGLTKLHPDVPEELRGTYAGLAHEATIGYLQDLGVTSIELLPIHHHVSEDRLLKMGLTNYWGYNTLGFFAPHPGYASAAAQAEGPAAVLRELQGMVKLLHEAGLEVILDVVYNHTAEEGPGGPTSSLRGLDNPTYYRVQDDGSYIDVTGCGNTVDASNPVAQRLILDSLRYWADVVKVDGFRFDLMATLGRDERVEFQRDHPLLRAILDDPSLAGLKLIAEPWDVGMGGWQVGNFPTGYSEWNDGYRDRMRNFWLRDVADARAAGGVPSEGIGSLARRLAGSNHVFAVERGPLASINFITAHDGFTAYDLVSYDQKHNLGNGEANRDGTDDNKSFNHGHEGPSDDPVVLADRRRAIRNLMGTLLLSAGVAMIVAGDEAGRTQRGNNNAYCIDSELTWVNWQRKDWQLELLEVTRTLLRLRRESPALRPVRYGRWGETTPSATQMDWYNKDGVAMSEADWDSPAERTLQYLAASTPEIEDFDRILLVVHGLETEVTVTLPEHAGVTGYTLLWDSTHDDITGLAGDFVPGQDLTLGPTSMLLFRAEGTAGDEP